MPKRKPIPVTGIWLRTDGDKIIVEVEINGEWIPLITEFAGKLDNPVSHIVEPLGMQQAHAKYQGQHRHTEQPTERTE